MPGEGELTELARILEWWRLTYANESLIRHRNQLQDEALVILATLDNAVSKITVLDETNFNAALQDSAPPAMLRYLHILLEETNAVRALIKRINGHPGLAHSTEGYGVSRWRWAAEVLLVDFVNAMKAANPTFAPGISHAGPLSRYIKAVAPLVTGEHPSAASVATQLKKLPREKRLALKQR
jgi:hypothetical protein